MSKTLLTHSFLLLFALAPLTGCMMGPTDQYGIQHRKENLMPYGFTLNPEETVQLQAQHPRSGYWYTIATTSTGSSPIHSFGYEWYHWSISQAQVPAWAWTRHNKTKSTAEIRTVGSDGEPLWTFNYQPFDHWDPNGSLENFWRKAGAKKQSATIICHTLY